MVISLVVAAEIIVGLLAYCVILWRKANATPEPVRRNLYFRTQREDFDLEKLRAMPKQYHLRQSVSEGEEAQDILDKLGKTLQYQQQKAIANLTSLEGILSDPRDRLIWQAGWIGSLIGLEEELRGAIANGMAARAELTTFMQLDEEVVAEPIERV